MDERLDEELEMLSCVCLEDVKIYYKGDEKNREVDNIYMTVYPATAGIVEEQFVCIHVHITLPTEYPDRRPEFELRKPRGLSEQAVCRLKSAITDLVKQDEGNPVLYQIFELVRSRLSDSNVPHGVCSICLADFMDEPMEFIKTDCYHYFHKRCIYQYKEYWLTSQSEEDSTQLPAYQKTEKTKLVCPECREVLNLPDEEAPTEFSEEPFYFKAGETLRQQQREWRRLYNKQKSQGGIIDVEAERQKYRLPPPVLTEGETDLVATGVSPTEGENGPADKNTAGQLLESTATEIKSQADVEGKNLGKNKHRYTHRNDQYNGCHQYHKRYYHHQRQHHQQHHHHSHHHHGNKAKYQPEEKSLPLTEVSRPTSKHYCTSSATSSSVRTSTNSQASNTDKPLLQQSNTESTGVPKRNNDVSQLRDEKTQGMPSTGYRTTRPHLVTASTESSAPDSTRGNCRRFSGREKSYYTSQNMPGETSIHVLEEDNSKGKHDSNASSRGSSRTNRGRTRRADIKQDQRRPSDPTAQNKPDLSRPRTATTTKSSPSGTTSASSPECEAASRRASQLNSKPAEE